MGVEGVTADSWASVYETDGPDHSPADVVKTQQCGRYLPRLHCVLTLSENVIWLLSMLSLECMHDVTRRSSTHTKRVRVHSFTSNPLVL